MSDNPIWMEDKQINEQLFVSTFLKERPLICLNNTFFTVNGKVQDEESLKQCIYDLIKPYITTGLAKKTTALLDVLRLEARVTSLPLHFDRIHMANGTLYLDGRFEREKQFCHNRLTVDYNPNAPKPVVWLNFLSELLSQEDILTLQEYLGYCLIPSTKAQKMLLLVGQGGEGKSRIGIVLRAILGNNLVNGNLNKIEMNRFARADLEFALVMLDDDIQLEALSQTNYIKTIITAELPMDLERKGKQSYQGKLYVRFLCFGNGTLKSLYDRSEGFFRRQIILTTKRPPKDRVNDPFLAEKMVAEKEGIFLWCLEGLKRLMKQNYQFTLSEQSKENLSEVMREGNNVADFMESEGYVRRKADGEISSKELYNLYKLWCEDNTLKPLTSRSFGLYLNEHQLEYGLEHCNNVYIGSGRRARGYMGLERVYEGMM